LPTDADKTVILFQFASYPVVKYTYLFAMCKRYFWYGIHAFL